MKGAAETSVHPREPCLNIMLIKGPGGFDGPHWAVFFKSKYSSPLELNNSLTIPEQG